MFMTFCPEIICCMAIKMEIENSVKSAGACRCASLYSKYSGKIIVVKYGGNAMICDELKEAVMSDIVLLSEVGIKVVLVHGGGPEINEMLKKMGKESKFINGLRYTDAETAEIVQMVLAGKVNKGLVGLYISMAEKHWDFVEPTAA